MVLYFYSLYAHTVDRDNCATMYAWLNFFKWILSKHSALANGIISILTRLCTGKPSNFGLISDQNILVLEPPSCLFNGESMRMTKCYHLVLKLRMYGVIPYFPPIFLQMYTGTSLHLLFQFSKQLGHTVKLTQTIQYV